MEWLLIGLVVIGVFFAAVAWIGFHRNKDDTEDYGVFEDTPEAWKAREVIPGETREQARARLAKYRVR